jgi:hypothetical protein
MFYGDPSGGMIFQILAPLLAVLWGMWIVFANRVRRFAEGVLARLRGKQPEPPVA